MLLSGLTISLSILSYQANKILMKKIEADQFLDLMTVKTEVRSVCKEPYRSSHGHRFYYAVVFHLATLTEQNFSQWYNVLLLACSCALVFVCSIYKSVLKSKGSINEINQIAQVCCDT